MERNGGLAEMPLRAEIKERARMQLRGNLGACIGVIFTTALISFGLTFLLALYPSGSFVISETNQVRYVESLSPFVLIVSAVASILVNLFMGTFTIESEYFHLRVYRGETMRVGQFLSGLLVGVGKKIHCLFRIMLFAFLWMIPFVVLTGVALLLAAGNPDFLVQNKWIMFVLPIPAYVLMFVKILSYSMMSYIIRDCPDVSVPQAMRLSIRMMKGHRWRYFVQMFSFILWYLASIVTLYLLLLFYVAPYVSASMAGFYDELKNVSLANGVITEDELR